ncbi:unnamed protein product [Parajaminaea phylloscopi]
MGGSQSIGIDTPSRKWSLLESNIPGSPTAVQPPLPFIPASILTLGPSRLQISEIKTSNALLLSSYSSSLSTIQHSSFRLAPTIATISAQTLRRTTASQLPKILTHHQASHSASSASSLSSESSAFGAPTLHTTSLGTTTDTPDNSPVERPDSTLKVGQHVVFEISGLRVEGLIQDMVLRDVCHVEIIGTGGRVISMPSRDLKVSRGRF